MTRIILWGAIGGMLLALLRLLEYQYLVRTYPGEVYVAMLAILFTAIGVHLGRRSRPRRDVAVEVEVAAPAAPFARDDEQRERLGITAREQEILELVAEGLSNREIGERLFISENTVKTHSSRLFDKLGARRRVQAVIRGREAGLIP